MPTSGSIDFVVSRDDIITEALEQVGALAEGQPPNADQLTSCGRTLNMVVKAWQADGANLFAVQRLYMPLVKGQEKYSLVGGDTVLTPSKPLYHEVDAGTGTTITLSSAIEHDRAIGSKVILPSGAVTELASAASKGDTTIDVVSGETVEDDDIVIICGLQANRPMKLLNVSTTTRYGTSIPAHQWNRQEYADQTNKPSQGTALQVYYDPQIGAGELYVWQTSDNDTSYLDMWVQRTLEDFDSDVDTPDFPQEWYLALAMGLAKYLIPKYGTPREQSTYIVGMAEEEYERAASFDVEHSVMFQPDLDR